MLRLTVLGNLTIDEIARGPEVELAPGGSAFYVSSAASYLGDRVRLVSTVGRDYPRGFMRLLRRREIDVREVKRTRGQTTRFRISYRGDKRTLWLLNPGTPLEAANVKPTSDSTHLGPVYKELSGQHFYGYRPRTRFLSVDAQGLLRTASRNGRIGLHARNLHELFGLCDLVKLSEEEAQVVTGQSEPLAAIKRLQRACRRFILVTRGAEGTLLFVPPNRVYRVPSFPEKSSIDPTGAGDTFVAAWLHTYCTTGDPLWAASVGSAFASLVVREFGPRKFRLSRKELLRRSGAVYAKASQFATNLVGPREIDDPAMA